MRQKNMTILLLMVILTANIFKCSSDPVSSGASNSNGTNTVPLADQGSPASPIALTIASMPYTSGAVGNTVSGTPIGYSFYAVSGMIANHDYIFEVTNISGEVNLEVTTSSSWLAGGLICFDYTTLSPTVSCSSSWTLATQDIVYIDVRGVSASTFTLNVIDLGVTPVSQGTSLAPIDIPYAQIPYNGTVAKSPGKSYYTISGLTVGKNYSISMSYFSQSVRLRYFGASNTYFFTICEKLYDQITVLGESCFFNAPATTIYIQVDGLYSLGANFTLSMVDLGLPPVSEGTTTVPVALTFTQLPYNGTVGVSTSALPDSYYTVSGVIPGHIYEVSLSSAGYGIDLYYYDISAYANLSCSSTLGIISEVCYATATGTTVFIKVHSASPVGDSFVLNMIDKGLMSTIGAPNAVTLAQMPYSDIVINGGNTYYAISGLIPGAIYEFTITGLNVNLNLYVYDTDNTFTTIKCSSIKANNSDEKCMAKVTGATIYLKVFDTNITNSQSGSAYILNVSSAVNSFVTVPSILTFDAFTTLPNYFFSSGDASWVLDTTSGGSAGTANSIASGAIGYSKQSCVSIFSDNTAAPGTIVFDYKTDICVNCLLKFYVNDVLQTSSWSGVIPWTTSLPYNLPAGVNEMTWCYEETIMSLFSSTTDTVWIDSLNMN